jgi:hypothetical protein
MRCCYLDRMRKTVSAAALVLTLASGALTTVVSRPAEGCAGGGTIGGWFLDAPAVTEGLPPNGTFLVSGTTNGVGLVDVEGNLAALTVEVERDGQPVAGTLGVASSDGPEFSQEVFSVTARATLYFAPTAPFAPGASYDVRLTPTVQGQPLAFTFATAAEDAALLAPPVVTSARPVLVSSLDGGRADCGDYCTGSHVVFGTTETFRRSVVIALSSPLASMLAPQVAYEALDLITGEVLGSVHAGSAEMELLALGVPEGTSCVLVRARALASGETGTPSEVCIDGDALPVRSARDRVLSLCSEPPNGGVLFGEWCAVHPDGRGCPPPSGGGGAVGGNGGASSGESGGGSASGSGGVSGTVGGGGGGGSGGASAFTVTDRGCAVVPQGRSQGPLQLICMAVTVWAARVRRRPLRR